MSDKLNQNEPDNFGSLYYNIYDVNQRMNTFTPGEDYDLDYIVLEGRRTGNCISVDVDIYLADEAHKPKESSLANVQVLQAAIGTSEAEITFTLASALSLTNGTEYAVVVSCAGPNSSNMFRWSYGFSNTGYSAYSTDSGSSWLNVTSSSGTWFQAWGTAGGGVSQANTPSPTDEAADLQSGSVDLSWVDDNDPAGDSYDINFGPTGSMILIESEHGSTSYSYTDDMILGQEYSWRIDINIGEEVVTGAIWTFTIESFAPPSQNMSTTARLIAVSNNELWYEDV